MGLMGWMQGLIADWRSITAAGGHVPTLHDGARYSLFHITRPPRRGAAMQIPYRALSNGPFPVVPSGHPSTPHSTAWHGDRNDGLPASCPRNLHQRRLLSSREMIMK